MTGADATAAEVPHEVAAYVALRAALDAQWDLLLAALAGTDPTASSRCTGWTVRDLDAHLGATTLGLVQVLQAPAPRGVPVGLAAWADALPGLAPLLDETARTARTSFAEAVPLARAALVGADPARLVRQRTGAHTVADAVLFRLLEAVVHGRDLPDPLVPDPSALELAVTALTRLLAERVPGRRVEVRVPPYAAVRRVDGSRHTRGTPPDVVEVDPVTFVEVCAGRTAWADAVSDGRVRTWGDRADLSPWLPLLT